MNLAQAQLMVRLQDSLNVVVNPNWVAAGNNWLRAAMVEGVEAIEHHGWKWWKKQEPDTAQLKMELVDIWHFLLSETIVHFQGALETAAGAVIHEADSRLREGEGVLFNGTHRRFDSMSLLDKLQLAVGMNALGKFSIPLFFATLDDVGMTGDDLTRMYVGKNVLNTFRQAHGYKDGTYVKMWEGREDNEWMVELAEALDVNDPEFAGKLANLLEVKYSQVIDTDTYGGTAA